MVGIHHRALRKEGAWSELPGEGSCLLLAGEPVQSGQDWMGQPVGRPRLTLVSDRVPAAAEMSADPGSV